MRRYGVALGGEIVIRGQLLHELVDKKFVINGLGRGGGERGERRRRRREAW